MKNEGYLLTLGCGSEPSPKKGTYPRPYITRYFSSLMLQQIDGE